MRHIRDTCTPIFDTPDQLGLHIKYPRIGWRRIRSDYLCVLRMIQLSVVLGFNRSTPRSGHTIPRLISTLSKITKILTNNGFGDFERVLHVVRIAPTVLCSSSLRVDSKSPFPRWFTQRTVANRFRDVDFHISVGRRGATNCQNRLPSSPPPPVRSVPDVSQVK